MMKKIGEAIKGVGIGILLILVCIVLLAWNEYNNVNNIKAVAEARKDFIQIVSDAVNPENEGKLTAASGKLDVTDETVSDSLFNVSVHTAKLMRTVEMYQWKEESKENNGNKTYSYKQVWSENPIDSSGFHTSGHENPGALPFTSQTFLAEEARLGAFVLSGDQKAMLPGNAAVSDFSGTSAAEKGYTAAGEYLYSGASGSPKIGDVRVSYTYNNSSEISLLARQTGDTFTGYKTKSGVTLNKVVDGIRPGEEIIDIIQSENNFLKWILRAIGILFMFIGFMLIFKPLCMAGAYIPILGSLVNTAAGFIAFVLGVSLSLIVIAVSWIFVRPLLGIGLLVAVVVLMIMLARYKRSAARRAGQAQA